MAASMVTFLSSVVITDNFYVFLYLPALFAVFAVNNDWADSLFCFSNEAWGWEEMNLEISLSSEIVSSGLCPCLAHAI
jgi:hypothetical protein